MKEKNDNQSQSNDNEGSTEQSPKKFCKCLPKCIACCATADLNDKDSKIVQTTIYCSMCLVALCIKKKGKGNRHALRFSIKSEISQA